MLWIHSISLLFSFSDLAIRCLCSTLPTSKESLPSHQHDSHYLAEPSSGLDDCTAQALEVNKKPKMSLKYVRKFAYNESWKLNDYIDLQLSIFYSIC